MNSLALRHKYRCARAEYPNGSAPEQPSVGIVLPVYNENATLDRLAADLSAQDYANIAEIWFVDGGSTDGSLDKLRAMAEKDTRIRLAFNTRRLPAAALNLVIPQMRTDLVLRLDAHASYASDAVRASVAALLSTGAGAAGAIARPLEGDGMIARSIVAAHRSRFGLGGARFRDDDASGWVDTVWNGCYWRHVIEEVGPLREDLWRAEDNDFNERVRRIGYGLFLSPDIRAFYQPRTTYAGLWSQYMSNGTGVAYAWFENPRAFGLRHLVPLALICGLLVLLAAGLLWAPAMIALAALLGVYVLGLLAATAAALRSGPRWHLLLLPVALATLHFSYGTGALRGLWRRRRALGHDGKVAGRLVGCLAAGCWLAAAGNALAAPPSVWVASSMERVGRSAPAQARHAIELFAARREYESAQIVIARSPAGLSSVVVDVGDLVAGTGARLPRSSINLYREHYVQVTRSSPDPGGANRPLGPGWYADPLEPIPSAAGSQNGFAVPPLQNQPLWVDIFVPEDASPGRYEGTVTVRSDQGSATAKIVLTVWSFTLPLSPALDSMFLFWTARDEQAAVELLKHRLMPRSVKTELEPRLIQRWGLKSANIGLWSDATHKQCTMKDAPSLQTVQQEAGYHDSRLDLYNYTADEIDRCPGMINRMRAWGRVLHAAGVNNLVTMSPLPALYDDGSGSGRSAVDIWVLLPVMFEKSKTYVADVLRKGDKIWSYNALVQDDFSPKWEIDFAPINFRIMPGFLNQSMRVTGLLYWRVDLWTDQPWLNVQTYGNSDGNEYAGEGMLVYPGQQVGVAGVIPSIRLKWLRDGVDDYDYLELLKQSGCSKLAGQMIQPVAESWRKWTKDPAVVEAQRVLIGSTLDRIASGEMHCAD